MVEGKELSWSGASGGFLRNLRADGTLDILYGTDRAWYEKMADHFAPFSTATSFGLEAHLGQRCSEGGYFLYITRTEWEQLIGQGTLRFAGGDNSSWKRIISFADRWRKNDGLCRGMTGGIWLEADVDDMPEECPVPSLFFGVHNQGEKTAEVVFHGLELLQVSVSSIQKELLREYFSQLGSLVEQLQVGVMLARPGAPVRLCGFLSGKVPDMGTRLYNLGIHAWKMNEKVIEEVDEIGMYISAVDIDWGEFFGTKVGVEMRLLRGRTIREQRNNPILKKYLEWLVEKGWALPDRSQGVAEWIGGFHYHPDPMDFWSPCPVVFRTVSHCKMDFLPEGMSRTKAYLEYVVRPSDR